MLNSTDFDNATPFTGKWEEPDLSFVDLDRSQVPPFPTEILGQALSFWVRTQATAKSCPPDYIAASFLSGAAAMVGSSRRIEPWASWSEPVALWTGCVGLPSSGKSPAADCVLDILRAMEAAMSPGYDETHRIYLTAVEAARAAKDAWAQDVKQALGQGAPAPTMPPEAVLPDEPVRPRCVMNDATVEALSPVLTGGARLLVQRDELAGWLSSMTRYSGGSDRPFWLEAFGGRPYTVDRVKNGGRPLQIPSLLISIAGGIQPERLMEFVHAQADDGLFARILWFWPERVPLTRPQVAPDNTIPERVLARLRSLTGETRIDGTMRPISLPFALGAADHFEAWRASNQKDEDSASGIYLGFLGKMPGVCVRIAGLLQLIHWAESDRDEQPAVVSRDAVERAATLIDSYLKPHARKTFGEAALPQNERDAAAVVKHLRATREAMFNLRDLYRRDMKTVFQNDAKRARAAAGVLADANIIRADPRRSGESPGRKREDFNVNPALWLGR